MPKIAWASDIHINFAKPIMRGRFLEQIRASKADWLLLTGDLAESDCIEECLTEIHEGTGAMIAYVLGNHDYYGSSIATVRAQKRAGGVYLTNCPDGVVLTDDTVLLGVDGWYDARAGWCEPDFPTVIMNDWQYIEELAVTWKARQSRATHETMARLADADTALLRPRLEKAAASYGRVLVATHVPPFEQASYYRGRPGPSKTMPYYCNTNLGAMLQEVALNNPDVSFEVYCGHTHDARDVQIEKNLWVHVAGAEYHYPRLARVLDLSNTAPVVTLEAA
jgi:predicted phosphohydrolase